VVDSILRFHEGDSKCLGRKQENKNDLLKKIVHRRVLSWEECIKI
jgi:hypothetical protein